MHHYNNNGGHSGIIRQHKRKILEYFGIDSANRTLLIKCRKGNQLD